VKSNSPFFTSAPSVKCSWVILPETCGVIDDFAGDALADLVEVTGTSFVTACAVVTAAGGRSKDWACFFLQETMAADASRQAAVMAAYRTRLPCCPRIIEFISWTKPGAALRRKDSRTAALPHQRPTGAISLDSAVWRRQLS
jgi:hypothetical protein